MKLMYSMLFIFLWSITHATEMPFWKAKEKVYKRVAEQREVVVSVKVNKLSGSTKELVMQGAGHASTPLDFTYQEAKKFENFPKMSGYVRETQYTPQTKQLFMHSEAFGYHARMLFQLDFKESDEKRKVISYKIISGVFAGMQGELAFEDVGRRKTEISMTGVYPFEKLPVPAFFAEFGLEVILQKMATRIRAYVEEQYQKVNVQKEAS